MLTESELTIERCLELAVIKLHNEDNPQYKQAWFAACNALAEYHSARDGKKVVRCHTCNSYLRPEQREKM